MIYVLDTNVIRTLLRFFPKKGHLFETIWKYIDEQISLGNYISVDECYNELEKQFTKNSNEYLWIKRHNKMFKNPNAEESQVIARLFQNPKMQESIHLKNIIENRPSADVYIVAKAQKLSATVVTSEKHKPNSAQLPNLCDEIGVAWISYDDFMEMVGDLSIRDTL